MENSKVTREAILAKTHYGLGIYAHVLRKYYPGEVVLKVVGRDCGLTRNPFNDNKPTLHVWLHKEVPGKALSAEWALHKDLDGAIPEGDAFDFAALHYNQSGDELLDTLNQEMFLHIGEERSFYSIRSRSPEKRQSPSDRSLSSVLPSRTLSRAALPTWLTFTSTSPATTPGNVPNGSVR